MQPLTAYWAHSVLSNNGPILQQLCEAVYALSGLSLSRGDHSKITAASDQRLAKDPSPGPASPRPAALQAGAAREPAAAAAAAWPAVDADPLLLCHLRQCRHELSHSMLLSMERPHIS